MYLKTISPAEATGELAGMYQAEIAAMGRVMEATSCWSARPDMILPIEHLLHQMRDGCSLGLINFRLITLIAAKHIPSSYCSHVYFYTLSKALGRDKVLAIQRDFRNAGLEPKDVAMLAYAEQIAIDASKITEADIAALRAHGFTDINIADIALAASFRSFMSRYFDAVGATVEPSFLDDDPAIRAELAVGKK
ncbi:MAG: alkylhydroperoxidase [Hyphomicrobiales bacterium]|nr:MAG: alkylhydroperoxidase [Hyphomicrobiales bacterium]